MIIEQAKGINRPEVRLSPVATRPELAITDIVARDGGVANPADTVGALCRGHSTGEEFDASWNRGDPHAVRRSALGTSVAGWDQGVQGMKVGGRAS